MLINSNSPGGESEPTGSSVVKDYWSSNELTNILNSGTQMISDQKRLSETY